MRIWLAADNLDGEIIILTPFIPQRIFRYAGPFVYFIQAVAIFAALASGAGIALQNLIFGAFITVITDYASGDSSNDVFLDDVAKLAYASTRPLSRTLSAGDLIAQLTHSGLAVSTSCISGLAASSCHTFITRS